MKKSSRLFQIVFVVLALFVATASFAPKAEAGLFDWISNYSAEKNAQKFAESIADSEIEGTTSNEVLTDNFFTNLQTAALFNVAPPGPNSVVMRGLNEEQKRIVYEKYGQGLIGDVSSAIAMMYERPASVETYVADLLETAHIVPKAQAQGLGFASLDPILETWKIFRNVAYLFFVIVFLVIGFMIMFRQKINGQTVVTAQQAIPKVVIALMAVTFSYAIAGFLIDLMYILMFLMIGVFNPAEGIGILSNNFLQIGTKLITGNNGLTAGAFSTMNEAVKQFADSIVVSDAASTVLGWLGGLTMALILSIAILIGVFKLFFELLKTYITIIVLIATAPLMLMFGALPGKGGFQGWIKSIFGNLMAFPVVLFALILYEMFTSSGLDTGGFIPPFMIGGQQGSGSVILSLVGIGIILIIPDLIKQMKKALKVDEGIFGTLAGAAVKQFGEGAPIGAAVGGTGVGGILTAPGSLAKAAWDNRKMATGSARQRRLKGRQIFKDTLYGKYGIANNAARTSKFYNATATSLGGKTPSSIKFAEDAVVKGSQYLSEDEHVKRVEGGGGRFKKPIDNSMSYEQRISLAESTAKKAQAERQRLEDGHYGQLIDSGGKKDST